MLTQFEFSLIWDWAHPPSYILSSIGNSDDWGISVHQSLRDRDIFKKGKKKKKERRSDEGKEGKKEERKRRQWVGEGREGIGRWQRRKTDTNSVWRKGACKITFLQFLEWMAAYIVHCWAYWEWILASPPSSPPLQSSLFNLRESLGLDLCVIDGC